MSGCCGDRPEQIDQSDPCCDSAPAAGGCGGSDAGATRFDSMIGQCLDYAKAAHEQGRPIVGILCEYTPRELILAAGAVPVCLCGGSSATIAEAERHLPANLCPLIKSTFGYHVSGSNPFLELASLIVAETTCDGKKKMYELMGRSRPMHVLELPQQVDAPDARARWRDQLQRLKQTLEERFDVEITHVKLRDAIVLMNRERRLRRELAALMVNDPPPLTGRELLNLKSSISGIDADLDEYERLIERYRRSPGRADLAGRTRVLMTGVPMAHGAERVLDIIEDAGGVVVAMENCTGLKPIATDVAESGDPLDALAEKYLHLPCSVMTPNDARLDLLAELAERYRPDCVIELIWQACLTYDVESARVRELAEQQLKLPYLRIETDYSPSDSARIAVRVEALFETARAEV